jgi:hypothetical protein
MNNKHSENIRNDIREIRRHSVIANREAGWCKTAPSLATGGWRKYSTTSVLLKAGGRDSSGWLSECFSEEGVAESF